MKKLDELLELLELKLDSEHIRKVRQKHIDAFEFKGLPPITVTVAELGDFTPFSYEEAFEDIEKMLYNELLHSFGSTYASIFLKDDFLPQIRPNYGVGIIASLFGAKCSVVNGNMPWVTHFDDINKIMEIVNSPIPKIENALGAKVLETYECWHQKLKQYPNCYENIFITQPDLQGPFDIAHMLVGTDVYYWIYDEEELLAKLLDVVTDTYIAVRKKIEPYLRHRISPGLICVHGCAYGGEVIIKDDSAAVNLSPDSYKVFSAPYNNRILETFGGGSLHYCGKGQKWHHSAMANDNLKAINFGNPELHDLKEDYDYYNSKNIPIQWWGNLQPASFLEECYQSGIKTGMSLAANVSTINEGKRVLEQYNREFSKAEGI